MPTTSARLALPVPTLAESAHLPNALSALTAILDSAGIYGQGTFALRPSAAGISGRFYWTTDTGVLYLSNGSSWIAIGPNIIGADSITAVELAANAVGAAELANDSVDIAAIQDSAVTNNKIATGAVDWAKIAASVKPSGGAGAGTEALRALGTVAGTALAGNHPMATPVTAAHVVGNVGIGGTYTIAAPVAGTYILEWGAPASFGDSQGDDCEITNNTTGGSSKYADQGASGGPALRAGVALAGGQVITFTVAGDDGAGVTDPWAKLTRTA